MLCVRVEVGSLVFNVFFVLFNSEMIYGVEAFPLLNEEVEDCPPTKAKLVLIDEFRELNQNNNFLKFSYVKLYFTTEEIIVARRKMWKPSWKSQAQAFTFSRLHKLSDIMLKKELHFTDIMVVVDSSEDQTYHYRIDNSGELSEWVVAFKRITELREKKRNKQQEAITTEATTSQTTTTCGTAVDIFEEESMTIEGSISNRFSALILWSRETNCLDTTASSNSVCSSQDLPSQLVTPVCNNQLSNPPLCKDTVLSCEEDVLSSPEPQESIIFDLGNTSISEEGDTNKEEMDQTYSLALEAWTPSNDATTSSCKETQVIPDDKIHTLDTTVSNKGHSHNESTSLTRGVQIVTRSDSTLSAVMSGPGAGNFGKTVQFELTYANLHSILQSVSCSSQSKSFLSLPLRHTQIRDKKVRFSPKQRVCATYLTGDSGSERCLIYEYNTEDDSFCIIMPENSSTPIDNNEDSITSTPLMPIRSAPTSKQEKRAMLAAHDLGLALTLPKQKLVSKLFCRCTTNSISDFDDSHTDVDSAETPIEKHQLSPTILYKGNFKRSSALHSPSKSGVGHQTGSGKVIENEDIANNKLNDAVCEVVKTISLESLDSYDGASSCYSRGSIPVRDVPNELDSEAEDSYYNNDILDISQIRLNIGDTLDTPMCDFDQEGSPFTDPTANTPTEDNLVFIDITTTTEDNEAVVTKVKKPGKKKRRWNRFRRKSPPPEAPTHSAANYTGNTPHKKRTVKSTLKRRLSLSLRSFSTPACSDDSTQKKDKAGFLKRKFSSSRESSSVCDDDSTKKNNKTAPKKEKVGFLKRRFSLFRESSPVCDDDSSQKNDDSTSKNKKSGFLKRRFSPFREGSPVCNDDSIQKKETGTLRKKSFPARETTPTPDDDNTPRKKEKRGLRRKLSSSLRT